MAGSTTVAIGLAPDSAPVAVRWRFLRAQGIPAPEPLRSGPQVGHALPEPPDANGRPESPPAVRFVIAYTSN